MWACMHLSIVGVLAIVGGSQHAPSLEKQKGEPALRTSFLDVDRVSHFSHLNSIDFFKVDHI